MYVRDSIDPNMQLQRAPQPHVGQKRSIAQVEAENANANTNKIARTTLSNSSLGSLTITGQKAPELSERDKIYHAYASSVSKLGMIRISNQMPQVYQLIAMEQQMAASLMQTLQAYQEELKRQLNTKEDCKQTLASIMRAEQECQRKKEVYEALFQHYLFYPSNPHAQQVFSCLDIEIASLYHLLLSGAIDKALFEKQAVVMERNFHLQRLSNSFTQCYQKLSSYALYFAQLEINDDNKLAYLSSRIEKKERDADETKDWTNLIKTMRKHNSRHKNDYTDTLARLSNSAASQLKLLEEMAGSQVWTDDIIKIRNVILKLTDMIERMQTITDVLEGKRPYDFSRTSVLPVILRVLNNDWSLQQFWEWQS